MNSVEYVLLDFMKNLKASGDDDGLYVMGLLIESMSIEGTLSTLWASKYMEYVNKYCSNGQDINYNNLADYFLK